MRALLMIFGLIASLMAGAGTGAASFAQAPKDAPKAGTLTPKVVLQTVGQFGIDVAAWLPDNRHVVTASGRGREFLIWEATRGLIVDRLRLPVPPGAAVDVVILTSMQVASDAQSVRIEGLTIDRRRADALLGVAYSVDLGTRAVTSLPAPAVPARLQAQGALAVYERWVAAAEAIYGDGEDMSFDEAAKLLPALPTSGDGKRLVRDATAFSVVEAGKEPRELATQGINIGFDGAALSSDGRWLALVDSLPEYDDADQAETPIELYDFSSGRFGPEVRLKGDYDAVAWLDAQQFVAMEASDDDPADADAPEGVPLPMLVVDVGSGQVVREIAARCGVKVLRGGDLIGAGLGNCRRDVTGDLGIERFDRVQARWRAVNGLELDAGMRVLALAVSERGDRLAVAVDPGKDSEAEGAIALVLIDLLSEEVLGQAELAADSDVSLMAFTPDGARVIVAANAGVTVWSAEDASRVDMAMRAYVPEMLATDGRVLLMGGALEAGLALGDLATGKALRGPPAGTNVTAGGFVPGKPLFWGVSGDGNLWLWDTRNWSLLTTTVFFGGQKAATLARDGRYDTNLGPDDGRFRWLMADARWQSLPPQTFMRDYFEPQLVRKVVDCTLAGTCASALKPLRSIAGLNRLLPVVQITDVRLADEPGQVVVRVAVRETREARSGRASGIYGVKLLLDNRQIDQVPPHFQSFGLPTSPTLAQWREVNLLEERDGDGVWRAEFQISVPTHHGGKPMEFAAYAFNEDRVKSDTARMTWTPPAMPLRPRRAFVLTIGVDDYAERRLDLNFAVADASVIADRLAIIPGYEMRRARLTSARATQGKAARTVTRADILGALGILTGFPPEVDQMARLGEVHDVRALEQTTPDDIVILSFSGHGHADVGGDFVMVPSDARWPLDAAGPEAKSVISAADLTVWLGFMEASDIAFIIDACHSGASVATPDFKPGPMGDAGLGQLAYDKGLRILAATQANDLAQESAALGQGLLTAALGEGLTSAGGPADLDRDGRVLLDEWLRFAVARLPSLGDEVRRGGTGMTARGVRISMARPVGAVAPKVQEPSLFDFNAEASRVVLRGRN